MSWSVVVLFTFIVGATYIAPSATFGQKSILERWHPTRVPANAVFIGDQACAECHQSKVASQLKTPMGMAMEPVAASQILIAHPKMTFSKGKYSYEITRKDNESFFTVTDGKATITAPIVYAFGQGKAGQTYILQHDGAFYESLVSFYNGIKGLDLTVGAPRSVPANLNAALGRRLHPRDAANCFACHSTGGVKGGQLDLKTMTHGVRCEGCHGPGGNHIAASKAGEPSAKLIFNPARLSGDELSQDFCASCHRGNEDVSLLRSQEINNVRFQPYRIFHSKCYSDDKRISCSACHDVHEELKVDAAYYDAKCMACHVPKGQAVPAITKPDDKQMFAGCKVETKNCASCHMPKLEPPGAHFKFTDHYIRVTKPNEAYQN
ncbi:MAG TPA: multiheme c-type cytochrome [Blastocatellia bacterium]|nr:multiheme c-type cytochrome [Blastocatellia bacterium]